MGTDKLKSAIPVSRGKGSKRDPSPSAGLAPTAVCPLEHKPAPRSPLGARLHSRRELGTGKLLVKAGRDSGIRGMQGRGMGSGKRPWTRPLAAWGSPRLAPGKERAAAGEGRVGTQGPTTEVQEPHPRSETSRALSRAGRSPPTPPPPPLPSLTAAACWLARALSAPQAPARRALCAHF